MARKYYEAYDDRYRQVHKQNLQWFDSAPTPIVSDVIKANSISNNHRLLELGCGEGRDAHFLLRQGFDLLATDISPEAIRFCRKLSPAFAENFTVLDCINGALNDTYDFIYAVAVVHMLVTDEDRDAFYRFIHEHLTPAGIALVCSMGDGFTERQTDITAAFDLQERIHEPSGNTLSITCTSCRTVNFRTFFDEIARNNLKVIDYGMTSAAPDFPQMMYAVIKAE